MELYLTTLAKIFKGIVANVSYFQRYLKFLFEKISQLLNVYVHSTKVTTSVSVVCNFITTEYTNSNFYISHCMHVLYACTVCMYVMHVLYVCM